MRRLIVIVACGFILTACANYLPRFSSFESFKSAPATEQLRIDSEPHGAEAKSSQGPACQTPCELSVASGSDFLVTVSKIGYLPLTVPVRPESPGGQLQPNPVFAELQTVPPSPAKKPFPKKKSNQGANPQ
jgi:hypothetical protein